MLEFGTAGPARRARRRTQPDEPRRRHPGGGRPRGVPAGRAAGPASRRSSSATTRATTPTSSPATPRAVVVGAGRARAAAAAAAADAGAGLRHPPPRRRRRRHGHREPQPAAGQRLQGLPRRRLPDRAAGRRRDRRRTSPRSAPVADVPRADDGWETLGDDVARRLRRRRRRASSTPDAPRDLTHRPHARCTASATTTVRAAFVRAGFPAPVVVREQAEPDPDFPTVAFPNPEEPGAMDLALAPRRARSAPTSSSPTTPTPTGARWPCPDPALGTGGCCAATRSARCSARTCVRRGRRAARRLRQLDRVLAAARGDRRGGRLRHEETLTGFKWIVAGRPGLRYGYEEALGYCVAPRARARQGRRQRRPARSPSSRPRSRPRAARSSTCSTTSPSSTGCTRPTRFSVRVADLAADRTTLMARLRAEPPTTVAGVEVARTDDLAAATAGCRRPRACATTSPTARGSSCGRAAPSPRSRSTSRSSSPSRRQPRSRSHARWPRRGSPASAPTSKP